MLKKTWYALATVLIFAAVVSSVIRALTPWLGQYKPQIEHTLTKLSGHKVKIERIESGWHWLQPVIRINEVDIDESSNHYLKIKQMMVGINLVQSLLNWQLQPGVLSIDGASFVIRQNKQGFSVDGFESLVKNSSQVKGLDPRLSAWLLRQQKFQLNNIKLKIKLSNGSLIPINNLHLDLDADGNKHYVSGAAELSQMTRTSIKFMGELNTNDENLFNSDGEFYLTSKRLLLAQWAGLIKDKRLNVDSGLAKVQLWLSVKKGQLANAQAHLKINNLDIVKDKKRQMLQKLNANLDWQRKKNGWQLNGDNIFARIAGKNLPENELSVRYNKKHQKLTTFIKHIDLSLMDEGMKFYMPEALCDKLTRLALEGQLLDSTMSLTSGKPDYVLTRFKQVTWNHVDDLPAVSNLSGALVWQPNQGHLEMDSQNALLQSHGQTLKLKLLSGIFNWKKLSNGWRVAAEQFVAQDKSLTLSSNMLLDGIKQGMPEYINLSANFSGKNVQDLKKFIPYSKLKVKLAKWLKEDIIKIGKVAGSVQLKGKLADFPFDDKEGEFRIDAHVNDVQLRFKHDWPEVKNVDGAITVNKRILSAEVHNADLNDEINVNRLNLDVTKLGEGQETLYVHGKVNVDSVKAERYVLLTPLKKHLTGLKEIDLHGPMDLDLKLEIPLYPENDTNIIDGKIQFQDNTATIKRWGKIKLNELSGNVSFDVDGITDSKLKAKSDGYPLAISMKNLTKPQKATKITVDGDFAIDFFRDKFKAPIFNLMKGHTSINADLLLTDDDNDYDTITINSDLQGMKIALPQPFNKSINQKRRLKVKAEVGLKKAIIIKTNYANVLSSALKFVPQKNSFKFESGEVRLGSGTALIPHNDKLRVIGSLDDFELKQWQALYPKLSSHGTYSLASHLNFIDLYFKSANIFDSDYKKLNLTATKKRFGWQLLVKNQDIQGKVSYYAKNKKHIDAIFDHLKIRGNAPSLTIRNPKQLLPMSIKIAKLNIDELELGTLDLKTNVKNKQFIIENAKLENKHYEMRLRGKWRHLADRDNTSLEGYVVSRNLSGLLSQFSIKPVVEAKYAELLFDFNWPNTLFNYSLKHLNGNLSLVLKNGRITHLDKATEEKLGLGKLLSILSLQTIPRRLVLDFSDLSKSGFSYDIFKGKFTIAKGNMSTKDSYIDGPVAYAGITGQLNLGKQQYDLTLKVAPHITASLPVVATIAGGPIAGIATWVASKIINQSMRKVSAYTYKISGPWDKPVVQQLSITHARRS